MEEQKKLEQRDFQPVRERIDAETQAHVCTFYFVDAEFIKEREQLWVPEFRELVDLNAIIPREIPLRQALCGELKSSEYCVISHRWLGKEYPDNQRGDQLVKIQSYLREHSDAKYVWYDFWW